MLVKVAQGQSFADAVKKLKSDFKPEACIAVIQGVGKTAKGDLLLRIKADANREQVTASLLQAVAGVGSVANEERRRVTVEILETLAEQKEVEEAIEKVLGFAFVEREVALLGPNKRWLIKLHEKQAKQLEQLGHLKVGYISSCIRRRIEVQRCYKCLEYGHTDARCKNKDRSKLYFRCGSSNHRKKNCKSKPSCFLCEKDKKHEAGTGACRVFREALEAARRKCNA